MKREKQKNKPTAPVIVARLSNSFGGRIALLFKVDKPYEHYTLYGEEVPYGAIESWQEVNLPTSESEDEKIRQAIVAIVQWAEYFSASGLTREDVETMLAWLEKQREQKPAKWSEEDKNKIERLRSIVNKCASYNHALDVNGDYCEGDYGELDEWLKSLRPQPHTVSIKNANKFAELEYERGVKDGIQSEKSRCWKPSEEQMKWLKDVIETAPLVCRQQVPLESLYADLQKLL